MQDHSENNGPGEEDKIDSRAVEEEVENYGYGDEGDGDGWGDDAGDGWGEDGEGGMDEYAQVASEMMLKKQSSLSDDKPFRMYTKQ